MRRLPPLLTLAPLFLVSLSATSAATGALSSSAPSAALSPADLQFFEEKIRPVLDDQCYRCHSTASGKIKGGLQLDTRAALLAGGDSGPAIVPGKPDQSLLIEAILYTNPDLRMPPKGNQLSANIVADFTEWIRRGAPDPRNTAPTASTSQGGPVPAHLYTPNKDHWSFKPVVAPAVPNTKYPKWCLTPVDNFILTSLEAAGLQPSAATDRRTLIRRITYDLTGLPPTDPEIYAFLNDRSPDAYAKVVDRLLASPHYGEHSARAWLDLARFSETKGSVKRDQDPRYAGAWTYRDYVIDAFNSDKPYTTFITEQLAADALVLKTLERKTLPADKSPGDRRILAAMGFLTLGNQFDGSTNDVINDRIDVTSKAFLGLTVSCARCHDHKFDPIPTKDYYSLYGIFASSTRPKRFDEQPSLQPVGDTPEYRDYTVKLAELDTQATALREDFKALRVAGTELSADKRRELIRRESRLQAEYGDLEATHPGAPPRADVLVDTKNPKNHPVLIRGEAQNKGELAPRRFLEILSPDPAHRTDYTLGSGRLELARDIASSTNPLTARVLVNRIWQQHFGVGFVATPDDLGSQSEPPSHPALLDYLADRFVQDGWSIKKLHRLIVLSATYQQGDSGNPDYAAKDPYNRLLWRSNLRRLSLEQMHDSIISIAGRLDPVIGGKSVRLSSEGFASRRALYTFIDRRNPPEFFTQFDFPSPDVPSGRRYETSTPQQALFFMNNPLIIETARKLTQRPAFTQLTRTNERVIFLYNAILQRLPTQNEIKLATSYVTVTYELPASSLNKASTAKSAQASKPQPNKGPGQRLNDSGPVGGARNEGPLDAWARLAHALFQADEAIYYH